jgi:regulator of nonsense transcripts 1
MPREQVNLAQNLIVGPLSNAHILTKRLDEENVDAESLAVFAHSRPLGLAPGYSEHGRIVALAISDDKNCLVINFKSARHRKDSAAPLDSVLCRAAGDIFAFDMGTLSMSLYSSLHLYVTNAVDIQSAFPTSNRTPLTAITKIAGASSRVDADHVEEVFRNPIHCDKKYIDLATRAWVSHILATYEDGPETLAKVPRINTKDMADKELHMLAKWSADALQLDLKKPTQVTHFATLRTDPSTQTTRLESSAYTTQVRPNKNIIMNTSGPLGGLDIHGSVGWSDGRMTKAKTSRPLDDVTDLTVTTIGRDDPTSAEAHRAATLLRILQGALHLLDNPWIQNIWFPGSDGHLTWPAGLTLPPSLAQPSTFPDGMLALNASQQRAVNTMMSSSSEYYITLIQGPPGTGKTSIIASFVQLSLAYGRSGIWIIAQSNVAVRNIAEKLIRIGFYGWRLLISKMFHSDWHEHLYSSLRQHIIRSDHFQSDDPRLRGVPVILCTTSMLANKQVRSFCSTEVPMNFLIVDEASQIEIGNLLTIFIDFKSTLRKVCFIGDDKQLPPHGQEDIKNLQSIFELPHLNTSEKVIFLNIQYRMPPGIGTFISHFVYEGKLQSSPSHPIQNFPCKFINAVGKESKSGNSYENHSECIAVIKAALELQKHNKSYRILTPFTAQCNLIEKEMKKRSGLEWKDKCFTVDSFQGNEDDYIIISTVRSSQVGFLKNIRRTNVMLTRCKRGMFIISSKAFCDGPGVHSLVGKLAGGKRWMDVREIEKELLC